MRPAVLAFLLAALASGISGRAPVREKGMPWPDCLDDTRFLYVHGSYVALHRVENPIRHESKRFKTLGGSSWKPGDVDQFEASRYFWSHKWVLRLAVDSTGRVGVGDRTFVIYPGEYPRIHAHADEEMVRNEIRDEAVFRFEPFHEEWVLVGTLSQKVRDSYSAYCAEILESLELEE